MATYKVPQDVEADDKLIGPFSFRQFIYLIVVAICGGLAFGLYTVFPGLVIIPIPVALFFLVLALPLKKDQPFEVYLAAMVRFALKPKMRLWEPEGIVKLVEVNSSKPAETIQLKEFTGDEAAEQLAYLASVVDTGGWSVRGVGAPVGSDTSSLNDDIVAETSATEDILDDESSLGQSFDTLLDNVSRERRANMEAILRQETPHNSTPPSQSQTSSTLTLATPSQNFDADLPTPTLPTNIASAATPAVQTDATHDQYIQQVAEEALMSRQQETRADIPRLANNNDLTVSAISREANRIKGLEGGEVTVELR